MLTAAQIQILANNLVNIMRAAALKNMPWIDDLAINQTCDSMIGDANLVAAMQQWYTENPTVAQWVQQTLNPPVV